MTIGRGTLRGNGAIVVLFVIVGLVFAAASPASAASTCGPAPLAGANVAGAEFNAGRLPGVHARDYVYPGPNEIALLQRLGLRLMRVPFLWERLQPQGKSDLDADEAGRLDAVVASATATRMTVVLDVHNYGAYRGRRLDERDVPPNLLPDLWQRLARRYQSNPAVVFGLMNEPHDIDPTAWARIAGTTLTAIRATGAKNVVLVPGTQWDGAHSWFDRIKGSSNAEALLPLSRDNGPVVFEVHQYFDDNFSGTAETCGGAARVPIALSRIAQWARDNGVRLMLGEFGVSQQPECVKALDVALEAIEKDRDVWYGWTYWAAGAWWGSYPFNIQTAGGTSPQGEILRTRAAALKSAATCATVRR